MADAAESEGGVEVEAVAELHAAEGLISDKPVHFVAVVVFEDRCVDLVGVVAHEFHEALKSSDFEL